MHLEPWNLRRLQLSPGGQTCYESRAAAALWPSRNSTDGKEQGQGQGDSFLPKTRGQVARRPACRGGKLGVLESKFKVMNVCSTQSP